MGYINFENWKTNIRFYFMIFNTLLALGIFFYYKTTLPDDTSLIIRLTQAYALTAVTYLYFALLATPLTKLFPSFPLRNQYIKVRRAIGVSTFMFATLHACFAFFGELGGFPGLFFLDSKYLIAISLSFIALLIVFLMAATSFDYWVARLTFKNWKKLHRFVYLAGILIITHALLLGSHFTNISGLIPQIFLTALLILLTMEMIRFDRYLIAKFTFLPNTGPALVVFLVAVGVLFTVLFRPTSSSSTSPFNIHSGHIQLAKDAQNGVSNSQVFSNPALQNIPGLIGDRTKRYTVSLGGPSTFYPNQNVTLNFKVYDAATGNKVEAYQRVYEKIMHLIIVDNELDYFSHLHPDLTDDGFNITTQFPHSDRYHLYLDFQPLGAIEQQIGVTVDVRQVDKPAVASQAPDENLTKTFGDYQVTLDFPKPLKSQSLSIGGQKLTFTIKNAKTNEPVTDLKPYLAAFGHLVMINMQTYDYVHVHPSNLTPPLPDANGGPSVEFLPVGIYGPIKPGLYRVFAQFNPGGSLFTSDFTIKVE